MSKHHALLQVLKLKHIIAMTFDKYYEDGRKLSVAQFCQVFGFDIVNLSNIEIM